MAGLSLDTLVWRFGSKSKHHENTCLKDCNTSSDIDIYSSTCNSEHNWEDMCIVTKVKAVGSEIRSFVCVFIVDFA
jgi:hypothetical protein